MKCRNCGEEIDNGSNFCKYCGESQIPDSNRLKYLLIGGIGGVLLAGLVGGWLFFSNTSDLDSSNSVSNSPVVEKSVKSDNAQIVSPAKRAEDELKLAKKLLSEKKYDEALKVATSLINFESNNYEAYLIRGNAYFALEDGQSAIKDFDAALKIKNDLPEAHYNKGYIWLLTKNYEKAIDCFSESLKYREMDANAFKYRGYAFLMQKEYTNAEKDLQMAAKFNDSDAKTHKYLADALYYEKKYEEAIAAYDKAIACDSNYQLAIKNKHISERAKVAAKGGLDILGVMTHDELATITKPILAKNLESIGKLPNINDDYTKYHREIGEELRKFSGNAIANKWRGEGVSYREMLIDSCKAYQRIYNQRVKFDDTDKETVIENALLDAYNNKTEHHEGPKAKETFLGIYDNIVDDVVTPAVVYIVLKRHEYCNMELEI